GVFDRAPLGGARRPGVQRRRAGAGGGHRSRGEVARRRAVVPLHQVPRGGRTHAHTRAPARHGEEDVMLTAMALAQSVKSRALELGFDRVAIGSAGPPPHAADFERWLDSDDPMPDRCGTCTACLDACPTAAFDAPYALDARRCIAYLTIEHRGPIAEEFHAPIGEWLFGCDVCQEVCPWNRHAPVARETAPATPPPPPEALVAMTDDEFRERFRGSPLKRARREGLARNAAI